MKRTHHWITLPYVLLSVLLAGWTGCGEHGILKEAPGTNGTLATESSCVTCHTSEQSIEATTDYVPPAEGSSGEG